VGASGAIFRTEDGGVSWQQLNSSTTLANLLGISFTDARTGTIVGSDGAILHTTDGGASWASQWPAYFYTLFGVSFTDANTGTVVGANFTMAAPGSPYGADSGRILRTTDGGATWKLQYAGGYALYGVSFMDANTGMAVGQNGTIMRTTDGGGTWNAQSSGTTNGLWAITFIDAKTAIVAGDSGTILRTTNTGVTWTPLATDTRATLWGISFADAKTGIVVGDRDAVLCTVDGGVTWKTLHDNNDGGFLGGLRGIFLTGPDSGTAVGGQGIWRTTDGGVTWRQQFSSSVGPMYGIAFTDTNTALAVGTGGVIVHTASAGEQPAIETIQP
jgi:photosystem II stability/assembly factor-like uncharacterized protein